MSVKTCRLCGKPLGRIRGSEGEFCSREHRNQFRLRAGMDRLEEANKVANVMRRREIPRQIPPSQLAAAGLMQPRGSAAAAAFPVAQPKLTFSSRKPVLFHTDIPKSTEQFSNPLSDLSRRCSANADRLVTPASLPIVPPARSVGPLTSQKTVKPAAGVARAGLTEVRPRAPMRKGEGRECGAALRVKRPAALPERRVEPQTCGAACLEKARQLQTLSNGPVNSREGDSRVYPAFEFQERAPVERTAKRSLLTPAGLPGPRMRPARQGDVRDVAPARRSRDIPRAEHPPSFPRLRVTRSVAAPHHGDAAELRPAAYAAADAAGPRARSIAWETSAPVSLPGPRGGRVRTGMRSVGPAIRLNAICEGAAESRPAEVRFVGSESAFDHAPMPLQGSFVPPPSGTPRVSLETVEEHFDGSLEQWTGDLMDWKLDAAGARPAGLALLRPTIGLADYEFEFFTRIESRAITFTFRAANLSNYFKVTIAMVESGRYELRRCAVIGGMEEPPASAPLPGVLRPGAAFTVKVSAWQNDFSIWLDGELAARWTDGRLPTGGIGFMAPRDDRARVYWVRLSQLEGSNLQAAAHRTVRSIQ